MDHFSTGRAARSSRWSFLLVLNALAFSLAFSACGRTRHAHRGARAEIAPPEESAKPAETAAAAETPASKADTALQPKVIEEPRRDPAGDPLPAGAIARLGTIRFRATAFAHAVAASPDGAKIASGHLDGVLRIFDTSTGALLASWPAHQEGVIELVWAKDNSAIYSGGRDGKLIAWDESGKKLREIDACDGEMSALAIDPQSKTIAAGCPAKEELRLISLPEMTRGEALGGHGDRVDAIAFAADGKTFAAGGYGGTIVVRENQKIIASIKRGAPIFSLAITADGRSIAAGGEDAQVAIFELPSKKQSARFRANAGGVTGLAFSDDGRALYSAGADGRVKKFEVKSGKAAWDSGGNRDQEIATLARLPGKQEVVTGGAGGVLRVWSETNGQDARLSEGHVDRVLCTAFSKNGEHVVSGGADGFVRVWNAESGKSELAVRAGDAGIEACVFSDEDRELFVVDANGNQIRLDAASGAIKEKKRAQAQAPRGRVAIGPDTKTIVELGLDGSMFPRSEAIGKVAGVAFDGSKAIVIGTDLKAIDARDKQTLFAVEGERADAATINTGAELAFACKKTKPFEAELELAAYALAGGQATSKRAVAFPAYSCGTLALSPSGDALAAAAPYSHVRPRVRVGQGRWQLLAGPKPIEVATKVFDPQKLEDAFALIGHDGGVEAVAFSPDGARIATAGDDTTVLIWSLRAARGK